MTTTIKVGDINIANNAPMVLIGGLNVLEDEALALEVADSFDSVCRSLSIPLYF